MVEPRRDRPEARRISPKVVLGVVVVVIVVILILQNTNDVRVDLLFWNVTAGLWVLLIGAVALGMLLGWLLPKLRRQRRGDVDADD